MLGGKLANVVGNTASVLYLSPVAENYTAALAWHDRRGRPTTAPTSFPATATVLPTAGWIDIVDNTIDCAHSDDASAGGVGIPALPSSMPR
jgi:hypothetical protein